MKRLFVFLILFSLFLSPSLYSANKSTLDLIDQAYRIGEIDYETNLIYRVKTIKHPEQIPQKYRAVGEKIIAKDATPILIEVRQNWEKLSVSAQNEISALLARPGNAYSYVSPDGNFRIHYDSTGGNAVPLADNNANGIPDYVENLALYADSSWRMQVSHLGYYQPPSDGSAGGDSKYDIYTESFGYYGYTQPESPGPQSWNDYTSYIAVHNNFIGFPDNQDPEGNQKGAMKVTVGHEFFHAVQCAYNVNASTWYMEVSSTWMEEVVFDPVDDNWNYLPEFFSYPYKSLQTFDGWHEYSTFLWNLYLDLNFGKALINDVWLRLRYTSSALTCLQNALAAVGSSRDAEFKKFTMWNYITNTRDDGLHYPEGASYPLISVMANVSAYPVNNQTTTQPLENLSANYIRFNRGSYVGTLNISFNGQNGYSWGAKILKIAPGIVYSYDEITLDGNGDGQFALPYFNNYLVVILVPSVLSISGTGLTYTYSAWITANPDTLHNVDVTAGESKSVMTGGHTLVDFYVKNTGKVLDHYSFISTNTLSWSANPSYGSIVLDTGQTDTVTIDVTIPFEIAVGTVNSVKLTAISAANPNIKDSTSLTITIDQLRGDVNQDGIIDIGDITYLISYVFYEGTPPPRENSGDVNCDGITDIGDIVALINYVFYSQPLSCP
jgi:hypothetical protein